MARVLFVWELGGDYGHLARLLPVAVALRERGHGVDVVVYDLTGEETRIAGLARFSGRAPNAVPMDHAPAALIKTARR